MTINKSTFSTPKWTNVIGAKNGNAFEKIVSLRTDKTKAKRHLLSIINSRKLVTIFLCWEVGYYYRL